MKSTISKRVAWAAALLCLVLLAVFASAASAAGLDRSYGQGGAVAVVKPATVSPYAQILEFAAAPDGSAYALAETRTCGPDVCTSTYYLFRYTATGALDIGFGSGGAVQLPASTGSYQLGVDAQGRALLVAIGAEAVTVSRYTATGSPDPSFGSGGQTAVGCACEGAQAWVMPARKGRILVETQQERRGGEENVLLGGTVTLTRLLAGGAPDPSFGSGGTTAIPLDGHGYPGEAAVTRKGAVVLGASGCCSGSGAYLFRVSAWGRLDTKFDRAAGRSLHRLRGTGELAQFTSLVPRPNGTLDILGNDPIHGGFDFRLKADGGPAKFGKRGLRKLPFTLDAAVAGSNGAVVVLGTHAGEDVYPPGYFAYRLLGDGRLDPAFGTGGVRAPLSGTGVSLGALNGGKVLVFDLGRQECREGCPATPGIARFLEGRARG